MLLGIERSAYLSSTTRCCEHRFNKGGVSPAGFQGVRTGAMQDPGYGLPRIPLPRTRVNRPFGFASHSDEDFSSSVSFFQIPHGFGDLAQWVSTVDDRGDLPRFGELLEY